VSLPEGKPVPLPVLGAGVAVPVIKESASTFRHADGRRARRSPVVYFVFPPKSEMATYASCSHFDSYGEGVFEDFAGLRAGHHAKAASSALRRNRQDQPKAARHRLIALLVPALLFTFA